MKNKMQIGRFSDATVNINNSLVINNTDFYFVFVNSQITVSVCTFKQNTNRFLIYFVGGNVSIMESVFEENMLPKGYVMKMDEVTDVLIKGSRFSLNSEFFLINLHASINRGTLGQVIVYNSIFDNNHAVLFLSLWGNIRVQFTNCVFNSNNGSQEGIVRVMDGPIKFTNCLFNNNTARHSWCHLC